MDKDIIKVDTIDQYNKLFGLETLHPHVAVVDLSKAPVWPEHFCFNYGFYCLYIKDAKCGKITYGRQNYDYQEGSIVCFAPGQVAHVEMERGTKPSGIGIMFHPDLIRSTPLGREISRYNFFSYEANEALHLSERERKIIIDCVEKIKYEVDRVIDKHSKRLIATNIELLLDYCMRFYDRQFITRSEVNHDILAKFERLLDDYFKNADLRKTGLPQVRYFADKVCLSPNYFGDLVKKETGMTAQVYIQNKIIAVAKEWVSDTDLTISQISYELGFQYSQHFNRFFKKGVGCTPVEYRKMQA
ncbi:MAG: AraC family transcriptional regulator [Bacteroides sp.]|nr:AraC family transcriptional regulator [Bacteroides sp.]